jgi:Gram-negative bacterial TonB protein C-terminal
MEIEYGRLGAALILVSAMGLPMCSRSLMAQGITDNEGAKPQVVLNKLFPPVYPPLARQARIAGDVHLKVSVHTDGSIGSVTPIDGPPLLVQAALDSAKQSQFECKECGTSDLSRSLTYSFQLPPEGEQPSDPCCCSHEPGSPGYKAPGEQVSRVSQSEDRITITAPPVCICPDACTLAWAEEHSRFRAAKCLYLWKCGHRKIAIQ